MRNGTLLYCFASLFTHMTIVEILSGSKRVIKENFKILAHDYREKTGREVCGSCPSDIQFMLLTLKNIYHMTQFKFKRPVAMYKNKKGDKKTISNATMTDARAIEFLKTKPKRIELFSEYPSNWKKLIKGEAETAEEKTKRLAAEAEVQTAADAKDKKEEPGKVEKEVNEPGVETEAEKAARLLEEGKAEETGGEAGAVAAATAAAETAATEAVETEAEKKERLLKMKLADLRKLYPEIKATSTGDFVEKVMVG